MNKVFNNQIWQFSPKKITLYGIILWLFLFLTASIRVHYSLSMSSMLFILINYISLYAGFVLINKNNSINSKLPLISKEAVKKILFLLLIIAVVGFLFRLIDKFVIREIVIGNTTIVNRRLLENARPSIFGVIAAVFTPFAFLPFYLFHFLKLKSRVLGIFCLIVFFLPAFDNIILGSRSGIFIVIILFLLNIFYFKLIKLTLLQIVVFSILVLIGINYTTKIFIERTKEFMVTDERAIKHILTNAVYNFTLKPKDEARDAIINSDIEYVKLSKLTYMNVAQYYCHGIFEFGYLKANYKSNHHYGAFMFGVLAKFSNLILGTNIDLGKVQDSPPRTGIYTSFFGPLYIDFGWFAPIFMFVFGIVQATVFNKVVQGNFKYVPLLFYFLVIDFFMPVINFIVSAQGLYVIVAMLVFILMFKLLTSKIYFKNNNGVKQYLKLLK